MCVHVCVHDCVMSSVIYVTLHSSRGSSCILTLMSSSTEVQEKLRVSFQELDFFLGLPLLMNVCSSGWS